MAWLMPWRSVRLSVRFMDCMEVSKHILQFISSASPTFLVFPYHFVVIFRQGPSNGVVKGSWGMKHCNLQPVSRFISETVQIIGPHYCRMPVCKVSNGAISTDLE